MIDNKSSLLFIIPDFFFIEDYQRKLYCNDMPVGTLQLLSFLKNMIDIKIDIIDFRAESENELNLRKNEPENDILKSAIIKVLEHNEIQEYQIIGINCYTSYQYLYVELLARIIKEEFNNKIIMVGGYHPTAVPEDFSYLNTPFDYIIRGESEMVLLDLLDRENLPEKNKQRSPRILSPNQLVDVKSLPLPDYELYLNKYPLKDDVSFEFYMSRGCPYQCVFCAENYEFRSYDFKTFKKHFNKFIDIVERSDKQISKIGFADQSFDSIQINKKVLEYILEKELQEKFTFSCQSRVETMARDQDLLDKIIKCGFVVGLGFETASKNLLLEMHKTQDPPRYIEMMKKILREYKIHGDPYCRLNIVSGFPGENHESFNETIEFINKNALHENIQISPSLFSNYPNLFVYNNMEYYESKYGTSFIREWWKKPSNPFKNSVPNPSKEYGLKELILDYKEKYITLLDHFRKRRPEIFMDLLVWKIFFNEWFEELENPNK